MNEVELNAPIGCLELVKVVHCLKTRKAPDWNNIYPWMIKTGNFDLSKSSHAALTRSGENDPSLSM